ncbi:MAG: (2Fe-2S) ferredoxin domain-containing protein [Bdellovibrionaceae bacterium]|nr:(2Fe-2S) ferredoxin domain-containing protein [Pseudobdellovibrionaceae bacterium]MDW8191276.1 (2Fe-2S) ferredoxin domain-containing protein [Pseudobdellovibrionaceae bacterium]
MSYHKHLFICTNGDPTQGDKCAGKGSLALHQLVKQHFASDQSGGNLAKGEVRIRINRSGCLGFCKQGICAVLYPSGRWFFQLKNDEASARLLIESCSREYSETIP